MIQLGGCLSLIRHYGLGGQLLGIYPITDKGGQLLFTPDADILVLCCPIAGPDGFAEYFVAFYLCETPERFSRGLT